MVRVWGATAPACVLFLLLVALCAWGAQAAPWRPPGADDDGVASPYPASQLDHGLEPQEDPRGSTGQVPPWNPAPEPASMGPTGAVLVGSGYSTPQPDVDHEPQVNLPDGTEGEGDPGSQMGSRTEALGDGLGPLTAKDNAEIRKSSPTSSDIVEEIIKELEEAAPGLVRETVPKKVLWRGSGRTLPLPGKRTEPVKSTAPPGPLRAKDNAEIRKSSPTSPDIIEDLIKELDEAAPGLVRETVPKEVLWRGSGRKLPLPGKRTEPVKSTAPPGPLRAKDKAKGRKLSVRYSHIIEEIRKDLEKAAPGVDGENNANTAKPQNFRSYSVGGAVAFLVLVLLGTVACCVLCACGALEAEKPAPRHSPGSPDIDTRSRSVSPYRQPDHRGTPESQARHQRPPSVPGRPTRLPPARPPQPPRTAADQWKARDRPSIPQSSWTQTSPPQPPPPSSNGWGSPPRGAALAIPSINIE